MVFPASTSAIYSSRSWECGTPGFPSSSITTSSEDHTESWRVPNLRLPIQLSHVFSQLRVPNFWLLIQLQLPQGWKASSDSWKSQTPSVANHPAVLSEVQRLLLTECQTPGYPSSYPGLEAPFWVCFHTFQIAQCQPITRVSRVAAS